MNLSVTADAVPPPLPRGGFGSPRKVNGFARGSPTRGNGDDRRQWRKQGGAVGAAASRMRGPHQGPKQTLGAATRAVALRSNDGEGKPGTKGPLRSDKQLFCQSDIIAVSELFGSVLALSGAPRQLPQRGSHWRVGRASTGRAKHDVSETVVLRCLGQRQLDKVRLSRSCCPL